MARSIWIDVGDDPHTTALHARSIRRAYFAAWVQGASSQFLNPRLTKSYLYGAAPDFRGGWRAAVGSVGVYYGASWIAGIAPDQLARQISDDLTEIGADNMQCAVDVNAEHHDFDLVTFLRAFRRVRPNRELRWVIEGMQGGRLTPSQVSAINRDTNLTVAAEAFYDAEGQSMLPYDADTVRANLIDFGVSRGRALVCYDAAHLHTYWDGVAFTQGRLPA